MTNKERGKTTLKKGEGKTRRGSVFQTRNANTAEPFSNLISDSFYHLRGRRDHIGTSLYENAWNRFRWQLQTGGSSRDVAIVGRKVDRDLIGLRVRIFENIRRDSYEILKRRHASLNELGTKDNENRREPLYSTEAFKLSHRLGLDRLKIRFEKERWSLSVVLFFAEIVVKGLSLELISTNRKWDP